MARHYVSSGAFVTLAWLIRAFATPSTTVETGVCSLELSTVTLIDYELVSYQVGPIQHHYVKVLPPSAPLPATCAGPLATFHFRRIEWDCLPLALALVGPYDREKPQKCYWMAPRRFTDTFGLSLLGQLHSLL